ncbi:MAG: hypothetical protein UR53_C0001G0112 [Candidatus Magasanikbacteria bacterium GW2011_GWC2_34_16]|uniref:Glycerophosphoryl diester phosphodiesterase membrane domain-containing protein n=2 Tax=Candidatus Magasanikiibacteriota TaxID=1752731 RepID=A0A0G0HD16_9BACT|nr:MAG: hypothetical protein UR53_C0001G0112 [Candidatus Magasanikbacteria bacterium GW2011_GWC2_34_16]KKQ41078.1 MAG: hypothetical protein US58_C0005G0003 [Candidatus Magasanikbacteria bacterium GW2011_GWA2_37_8]
MLTPISAVLSRSFEIYQKNWRQISVYLGLMLAANVIFMIASYLGVVIEVRLGAGNILNDTVLLILYVANLVFSLWVSLGLMTAIKKWHRGEPEATFKENLNATIGYLWPAIYTGALVLLIVLCGSLLFIIPGIIFGLWYTFTFYAIIFENKKGVAALKASKELVAGRTTTILGYAIVIGLAFGLISLVLNWILVMITSVFSFSELSTTMVDNAISFIVGLLIAPLSLSAMITLYFSAKENPVVQIQPPTPTN